MILSLGEDRCEGENDKVFTRSALIESDLWRAGEEVKAKKENLLRRAYVRARRADCVKVLVSDDPRARSGGGRGKVARLCAFVPVFCAKHSRCRETLSSGHHGVRFPFLFGVLRCGAMVRAQASLRCRGEGLRDSPDPQEGDDGDQGEAEHVARGDAQHFVHFATGWQTFEIATALAVEHEENGRQK